MRISIIIPCYNVRHSLKKSVNSILRSGLKDYEIVLVDDGSQDGTSEICEQLSETNQNIRVIHQPNSGVSSARNNGMKEANGEYIWFFDADDSVEPESMAKAEQIITEKKPDILMFGMSFDYYRGKRLYQRLKLYYDKERSLMSDELDSLFAELYHNNMLTPCWNKLFRRELLSEHDILFHTDMFLMEDLLFSLEALDKCSTVYILPRVIYHYFQGDSPFDRHVAERVNRVTNLAEYLVSFEPLLSKHPEIQTQLFFGLLRQKLSVQSPEEMAITAQMVCDSEYAEGKYKKYSSESDQSLLRQLEHAEFETLYSKYNKSRIRSVIITLIKQSYIYMLLKGVKTKRVTW